MRFYKIFLVLILTGGIFGCASAPPAATPLETLKAYTQAIKKKDTTTMKLLLSDASIKMSEQEAKAQNVNLDDIVKRETLFTETQKSVEFRNEKIEGERATIEMKDSTSAWSVVPFVREEGIWKIDKQGIANQMLQKVDEHDKRLDDLINQGRIP